LIIKPDEPQEIQQTRMDVDIAAESRATLLARKLVDLGSMRRLSKHILYKITFRG
jgi:hypothetical protein